MEPAISHADLSAFVWSLIALIFLWAALYTLRQSHLRRVERWEDEQAGEVIHDPAPGYRVLSKPYDWMRES